MYPLSRRSGRLALRELTADDVDAVLAVYGDPEVNRHMSFGPRTRDQTTEIVTRFRTSATATPRTEFAFAVTTRQDGEAIGVGRVATDPHQPGGATFGFALRPDTWGRGYGVETVRLLLGLAFEELGLHRVWGARAPLNEASARTMARAGMVQEGVIREHIRKDGQWRDSVVHAILDREWAASAGRSAG
ncbi:GNAT family N-acetyltransferase [Streptomyces nitrosporeus]|uniref:N-acetyltransferase n=1 Tax=Streptomyces nitrosporeus TaxID=28894 RepID=A0A5J6FK80_9ACTN|nr:GNAT family protein [Streptomyces nitrosporeus]QEU76583.1 N-acetyltransferase [Streptomyces nitrosporeus]